MSVFPGQLKIALIIRITSVKKVSSVLARKHHLSMNTEITMGMVLLLCSGTVYDNLHVTGLDFKSYNKS